MQSLDQDDTMLIPSGQYRTSSTDTGALAVLNSAFWRLVMLIPGPVDLRNVITMSSGISLSGTI